MSIISLNAKVMRSHHFEFPSTLTPHRSREGSSWHSALRCLTVRRGWHWLDGGRGSGCRLDWGKEREKDRERLPAGWRERGREKGIQVHRGWGESNCRLEWRREEDESRVSQADDRLTRPALIRSAAAVDRGGSGSRYGPDCVAPISVWSGYEFVS